MVVDIARAVESFQPHVRRLVEEPFHFPIQPVPHQFQRNVRVAAQPGRLTLRGQELEDLVDVGHIEIAAQAKVLRPPVVSAQVRMNISQPALSGGGIAKVAHVQLRVSRRFHPLEYLRDGIRTFRPLPEHIFRAHFRFQIHVGQPGPLLPAVVLLLHHQIELLQTVAGRAVLPFVKRERFQQADQRNAAIMLQGFHRYRL